MLLWLSGTWMVFPRNFIGSFRMNGMSWSVMVREGSKGALKGLRDSASVHITVLKMAVDRGSPWKTPMLIVISGVTDPGEVTVTLRLI